MVRIWFISISVCLCQLAFAHSNVLFSDMGRGRSLDGSLTPEPTIETGKYFSDSPEFVNPIEITPWADGYTIKGVVAHNKVPFSLTITSDSGSHVFHGVATLKNYVWPCGDCPYGTNFEVRSFTKKDTGDRLLYIKLSGPENIDCDYAGHGTYLCVNSGDTTMAIPDPYLWKQDSEMLIE